MFMKKILFLIIILYSYHLNAQIVIREEDDSETLVIGDGDKISKSYAKVTNNIWKVDVLGVVYGKYGGTYERELLNFLSIQASVGMTYLNFADYYLSLFSFDQSVNIAPGKNLAVKDYRFNNVLNAKPGYFFSAMPKIYYRGDGFEGGYLGLGFNYSKWNYKESKRDIEYNAIDNNQIGGELAFGYQIINGKMALDVSTFFGVNKNSSNLFSGANNYHADYISFHYGVSIKLGRYF